jgi:UTP--glucose-1-phosphate uridylyltransferase
MIDIFDERAKSVLAVVPVPQEDVSSYGIIAADEVSHDVYRVTDMVEKPDPPDAPSTLGSRGRYVFTPAIFDALERTQPGNGGEIQLTDAIKKVAQDDEVYAYVHHGPIYDVGRPSLYLEATIELALRRDDLAKPLREFLASVVERGS